MLTHLSTEIGACVSRKDRVYLGEDTQKGLKSLKKDLSLCPRTNLNSTHVSKGSMSIIGFVISVYLLAIFCLLLPITLYLSIRIVWIEQQKLSYLRYHTVEEFLKLPCLYDLVLSKFWVWDFNKLIK